MTPLVRARYKSGKKTAHPAAAFPPGGKSYRRHKVVRGAFFYSFLLIYSFDYDILKRIKDDRRKSGMKVTILSHTPEPEKLIAAAAKLCYASADIDSLFSSLTPDKVESFIAPP